jgi:hypothetical protein
MVERSIVKLDVEDTDTEKVDGKEPTDSGGHHLDTCVTVQQLYGRLPPLEQFIVEIFVRYHLHIPQHPIGLFAAKIQHSLLHLTLIAYPQPP